MERSRRDSPLPGCVAMGGVITGGIGLVLTFVAMLVGESTAAALFLLASAVVFGALANAMFRT